MQFRIFEELSHPNGFPVRYWPCLLVVATLLFGPLSDASAATIKSIVVAPRVIRAGTRTTITVTVVITDRGLIEDSVRLLQLVPGAQPKVIAAEFEDVTDTKYVAKHAFTLAANQTVSLAVTASFRGSSTPFMSTPIPLMAASAPAGFSSNTAILNLGGPLLFDNFGGNYSHGGVLPAGGAEMAISVSPSPPKPLGQFVNVTLHGSVTGSKAVIVVSGVGCIDATYSDSDPFAPGLSYESETVFCDTSAGLYRFNLTYIQGDPNSGQYTAAFKGVLNNVTLIP